MTELSERMDAKRQVAEALQSQSMLVWEYRVKHFMSLSREERLELKDAARTLNARADEVLEDALEEGVGGIGSLMTALEAQTRQLEEAKDHLGRIGDVLLVAAKVSKAAAGVVSGGITNALPFLN
jgi:hypothetical protein